MTAIDFVTQRGVDPARSLAADRHFMHSVRRASRSRNAVLRVYTFPGDSVSLGRYHLAPPERETGGGVALWRRISGGRAVPFGDGFVGISLVLPHRSAFYSEDAHFLAPYQVMNRYVRGLLEACKQVNIAAFYPGRDFITVDRRVLGLVSFETDESGALLFDAILANTRDFSLLPEMMEEVDPGGLVKIEMMPPSAVTCLARELRTELSFGEVAEMICRGFAKQFGAAIEPHTLSPLESQAIDAVAAREFAPPAWLQQRCHRGDLDRHAALWIQLGSFEAYYSIEQERFLKEIMFSGDFLANSASVERLERDLRLCPIDWRAIDAVANEIYAKSDNYILGIGRLRTIADMILRGAQA